jgi:hypothetical protein
MSNRSDSYEPLPPVGAEFRPVPPPPWWVRLLGKVVQRELESGRISVIRAMTYHECIQLGCSEEEARDYVQRAIEDPFTIVWRGHELVRTKAAGTKPPKGVQTQ